MIPHADALSRLRFCESTDITFVYAIFKAPLIDGRVIQQELRKDTLISRILKLVVSSN